MSGKATPLACCDGDCANLNWCRIGGYQCDRCGEWYCPGIDGGVFNGMNTYVCAGCAAELGKEGEQ